MIRNLKKRFIITAMLSVISVLVLIIGSINIVNYINVLETAESRLDMLETGGGRIPMIDLFGDRKNPLSPEAPFDSRYFSVLLDKNGVILAVDTTNIAAIGQENAIEMASELFSEGKTSGITDSYAYRLIIIENGALYIFLDHSREIDTFYSFLRASVLISLVSIILVFVLIVILSKPALNPVIESYEKQKRFITDAGHELKTPLTVISAANEVIELENGESQWTASIERQVTKLTELTNKLVILSRMSEEQGLNFSDFSLSDTLKECITCFEAVEYSKDKEIHTEIQDNIIFNGDEKAIAQLFSILTDNALKYSTEGSIINVSLHKTSKNIRLTFSNPAVDIPQGNNNILFERFYRHDSARTSGKGGHGIGLAAAKAIVDAHKGKISAESPDGNSFQITITF